MSYNHQAVFILLFVTFTCFFKSTSTEYLSTLQDLEGYSENKADKQPCPQGAA